MKRISLVAMMYCTSLCLVSCSHPNGESVTNTAKPTQPAANPAMSPSSSNANTSTSAGPITVSITLYSPPPMPRVSKAPPTAIEVAQVLKRANIFPKENQVVENPLNDLDKKEGAVTSVNIASARVEGMTIKVYQSPEQRNQARLRMINACPGCNSIVECGPIFMYEPSANTREANIMSFKHDQEMFGVLKRYFHCD